MKKVMLAFAFAFALTFSVRADEVTGTVACAHCKFSKETGAESCAPALKTADGKVYVLKGDVSSIGNFKKQGETEFKVTGKPEEKDGKHTLTVEKIEKKA
jgi:hypothetical protein